MRSYGIQKLLGRRKILLGVRTEPDKLMYRFCLQEEGQPAQYYQEEDCLKRVNCSRIVWCIWTTRKKWASDLFCGARSEYQYLSWHPGVFSKFTKKGLQESFQEARFFRKPGGEGHVWGWFLMYHMSEKKWPILDNRTDQLSKQRPARKSHSIASFLCLIPLLSPIRLTSSTDSHRRKKK